MLVFDEKYIGSDVLIGYDDGPVLTKIKEGFTQSRMMKILDAGYKHLFKNADNFIEKEVVIAPVPAKFKVLKSSDGKLTQHFRKQGVLIEKADEYRISDLKALGSDGIKKEFPSKSDVVSLAKRLNKDFDDCDISLKMNKDAMLKEIARFLEAF